MCTSDAWKHKDLMRQCSGYLYSVDLEEGAVSHYRKQRNMFEIVCQDAEAE